MLYELLSEYDKSGVTPMHMPGHKRNTGMLGSDLPYHIDITEISGFDELHDAHGILKELSDFVAQLYGCSRAFPLVNGSTGGVLAAVYSACCRGDTVIMARNCHKSVYNAILINGLRPVYLMPEADALSGICGSVTPEQVARAIEQNRGTKLVVVTSPTYEGVVSDIKSICDAAHRRRVPVLVDAAHGAHLGFSDYFPPSPARSGADITIVSLHKTLPALTQCALALYNTGVVDSSRIHEALSIFQTSSPSYVLLSSIDRCVRLLAEHGDRLFEEYIKNIEAFDMNARKLKRLKVLYRSSGYAADHAQLFGFDPGKIVISTRGTSLTGPALLERLRTGWGLELEMAHATYAVAMTSVCDSAETMARLSEALIHIDRDTEMAAAGIGSFYPDSLPEQAMIPGIAAGHEGEYIPLSESAGRVSLDYVWAYPPGIPFLVPGEIIGTDITELMRCMTGAGMSLKSTKGALPSAIWCLKPAILPFNIDNYTIL